MATGGEVSRAEAGAADAPCLIATNLSKSFVDAAKRRARDPNFETPVFKDINLALAHGRVYGVIGARGAGKSSLLRVLAGMAAPSSGRVWGRGRVASLFDVGGVLDGALSGRNNILAVASALGWTRAEAEARVDDIIAFAELAAHAEVPVARYSRGMRLRLGFSIVVSLEPDILFVNDVFGFGDLAFQKQCIERMAQMAASGATVVVATNDMNQVSRLCDEAIWISNGVVRAQGATKDVFAMFSGEALGSDASTYGPLAASRYGHIASARLLDANGGALSVVIEGADLLIEMTYHATLPARRLRMGFSLNWQSHVVFVSEQVFETTEDTGPLRFQAVIPKALISARAYVIHVSALVLHEGEQVLMKARSALSFRARCARGQGACRQGRRAEHAGAVAAARNRRAFKGPQVGASALACDLACDRSKWRSPWS